MPSEAQAQTDIKIGPRLGIPLGDVSDGGGNLFFGVDARIDSDAVPVVLSPSFDYYLTDVDNLSYIAVDLNGLYAFDIDSEGVSPYAGGGLAITRSSVDVPDALGGGSSSSTDIGLNLVGGARFMLDPVEPFVQLNAGIGGDVTRLGLTGGILFAL